jgi:hypothetical protein
MATLLRGAVAPTAAARDRYRLTTTPIALEPASFSYGTQFCGSPPPVTFGPIRLCRAMRQGRFKTVTENVETSTERVGRALIKLETWNAAPVARLRAARARVRPFLYSLYARAQQMPDPPSRILLSASRDAFWISRDEARLARQSTESGQGLTWVELFDRDIRARGLGYVIAPPEGWERGIIGSPHHIGTTPMSVPASSTRIARFTPSRTCTSPAPPSFRPADTRLRR